MMAARIGYVPCSKGQKLLALPGDILGRYCVEQWLGEGYEGQVFLARDIRGNERRTIKLLYGRQMLREAEHIASYYKRLRGLRAVKRFRGWGVLDGQTSVGRRPWLAFDYVDGETLRSSLAPGRALDPIEIIVQLCRLTAAVHRRGVGVGDFDGGRNLIVERGTGRLVLCDADAGVAGALNTDLAVDLHELSGLSRLIHRLLALPRNRTVEQAFLDAESVAQVGSRLEKLQRSRRARPF